MKVPSSNDYLSADNSIVFAVGPEMQQGRSGNLLMDEVQIYGGLYQQKMLEKVDRDEIMNAGRRSVKLFFLGLVVGGVANRLLTQFKIGGRDFLNLRLPFRLFIRFSIFGGCLYSVFLLPMVGHMTKLREYLNSRYTPRMHKYSMEMDPLIMNPNLLNEPGMSDDEKEYMRVFYDNMKAQGAMMRAQMRMSEGQKK